MPKETTIPFSSKQEDQHRLTQAGGSIVFRRGQPVFSFPKFSNYQEFLRLGMEARKRRASKQ